MKNLSIFVSVFLISGSFLLAEDSLLEKALVDTATTKEQKEAVKNYFLNKAKEHRKLAKHYRDLAELRHGGKSASDENTKAKQKNLAESLDKEAVEDEAHANSIK
ncbi:MAG: hypothetical protein K8R21_04905 [Leptospira sp.]|nr:hypothetical protein [Leptospira sp.]